MMKVHTNPEPGLWPALCRRPQHDATALFATVKEVFDAVAQDGDAALKHYTQRFDGASLEDLAVPEQDMERAAHQLSEPLKAAIETALGNITRFHQAQHMPEQRVETQPGVLCWRKALPIQRVGLYIPGGTAPLFSTVLMLAAPARIAGCAERVLCTPPDRDGRVHPAILYAARLCGITQVFRVGGIQAIAALVHGTETVPAVDKIFGPGNQYVTAAKQYAQLQGVAIDMPAGPSEVLVLADHTANPAFVAADLLSQAEHGADSMVVLVTTHQPLVAQVNDELNRQLATLPRRDMAEKALSHSFAVYVEAMDEALRFANTYAAEHLIVQTENAGEVAQGITAAGSVFIGAYTPESAGDYASGTNHTLPTNGFARAYSGVSLDSFMNKVTFQHISDTGLRELGPVITAMARAEQLEAHARAAEVRLNPMP
jgi:histidinol dehydrogenase